MNIFNWKRWSEVHQKLFWVIGRARLHKDTVASTLYFHLILESLHWSARHTPNTIWSSEYFYQKMFNHSKKGIWWHWAKFVCKWDWKISVCTGMLPSSSLGSSRILIPTQPHHPIGTQVHSASSCCFAAECFILNVKRTESAPRTLLSSVSH